MAKSRKQMRRNRKHRGGGAGSGYEPGGALNPGSGNGLMVSRSYDACMSSSRPGQMSYSSTGGLPGMRGGAYTTSLNGPIAGLAEYNKLPCTSNHVNPLNQRGGVGLASSKDMGVYEAHSARYTTAPSQWTGSTGAPVLLNQPLSGSMWSKSCTQTAGRRRRYGKKGKKTKRHTRKMRTRRLRRGGAAAVPPEVPTPTVVPVEVPTYAAVPEDNKNSMSMKQCLSGCDEEFNSNKKGRVNRPNNAEMKERCKSNCRKSYD